MVKIIITAVVVLLPYAGMYYYYSKSNRLEHSLESVNSAYTEQVRLNASLQQQIKLNDGVIKDYTQQIEMLSKDAKKKITELNHVTDKKTTDWNDTEIPSNIKAILHW